MVCQVFFLVFNCVRSQQHLIWETFPRKKKPFMTSCFLLSIGGGGGACLSLSGTNWTRLISFCSVPSVIDIKPYRDYSMYSSRQMEWTHITLHNTCSGLTNGMQFDTLLAMAAHGIATPQPATLHYVHYVMYVCVEIGTAATSALCKVRIFWEGHKIWKNLPLKIWRYWVALNST